MNVENKPQRVHIALSRVQTWLFAVPRLRAMVGANALLGETLRVELRNLARTNGCGWTLTPDSELYPAANTEDPLHDHDDPASDAKCGILARDGGHFEALFSSGAETFAEKAGKLLQSQLPGLRFHIYIDDTLCQKSGVHLSTELPVLAPCAWTGRGLASDIVSQGSKDDEDYEEHAVSLGMQQRHKAALRAENWQTEDLASLLSSKTKLRTLKRPQKLQELVGTSYLALIHADGNGVGSALSENSSRAERAAFFYQNRVLLRRAVAKAIDDVCDRAPTTGEMNAPRAFAPLIPLMLGGDDLLLVTRAEVALPFVVSLCAELESLQKGRTEFKLTLGVGVVIAKHTVPIHRLHEVAEHLASSSKRRFRGLDATKKCSVVDWAVFTTAWVDDPTVMRQRDWLRRDGDGLRVLSQRPVDVLGDQLDSLQGLLQRAPNLENLPRSQLRFLADQLSRGRRLSELAFQELPMEVKEELESAGASPVWKPAGRDWVTPLLDLVEIIEIARLGSKSERDSSSMEGSHV